MKIKQTLNRSLHFHLHRPLSLGSSGLSDPFLLHN